MVSRPRDLISYPENRVRSGYEITRDQETKGSRDENGFLATAEKSKAQSFPELTRAFPNP